jgi:prolyl oligopeptidase
VLSVTDDYYGTKVVDNYRYMEDMKDPDVQSWFKKQDDYTRATLAGISGREKLLARLRELDQSDPAVVFSVRPRPGHLYFSEELRADDNVHKLYVRHGLNGEARLLVDPGTIAVAPSNQGKGQNVMSGISLSEDCRHVAVAITPGGSERDEEVHVIDVGTGRETGDVILRANVPAWLPDNRSFIYAHLEDLPPGAPATAVVEKVHLHVLGRDPKDDPPVFGPGVVPSIDVTPHQGSGVQIWPNSRYAIGFVADGVTRNFKYYIEPMEALGPSQSAWHQFADFSDKIAAVAVHGDALYLLTSKDAARFKIVRTDARRPDLNSADVVVPASDAVVQQMIAAEDAVYVQVLDGGINRIQRVPYGPNPRVETVALPFEGSALLAGYDPRLPGVLIGLTSWTQEYRMYAYDPETKHVIDTTLERLGSYDRDDHIDVEDVKVTSADGTLVPLSIVTPKGMKRDGSNPTVLRGYGAYGNVGSSQFFNRFERAWHERGGVSATCGVRGGGEYGEEWHLAGKGPTKPNTWRDFIACATYLIDQKYTSPAFLAGQGASAGGIVIGRAITERPDLFGAAIIEVGALDMLRFETTAIGRGNVPEFGSTKTEDGFKALYAMSAYHHVTDGTPYPAVLLTTGMNDPRVDSWEPGKMTARLQAATSSGKPVLLRVDYAGGHGAVTQQQQQESLADEWSLLLWQFGNPDFQPHKGRLSPIADRKGR